MKEKKGKKEKLIEELKYAKSDLDTAHEFQSILRKATILVAVICAIAVIFSIKVLAALVIPALLALAFFAKTNVNFSRDASYAIVAIEAELELVNKREVSL